MQCDIFILECFNYKTFINHRQNELVEITVLQGTFYMQPHIWYYYITGIIQSEDLV